jgi:hypothetical protein
MLAALLFVGSVSAPLICPDIPPPPYNPKSPAEDIVTVQAYWEPTTTSTTVNNGAPAGARLTVANSLYLIMKLTFAAPTPPAGQTLNILVTTLQGNPQTETVILCRKITDPPSLTIDICDSVPTEDGPPPLAVYAWLGTAGTDRAPNGGFYQISSFSAAAPNQFDDPEGAVGGVIIPTNKTEILAPFLAIAGIIAAISTVELVVRRRKD